MPVVRKRPLRLPVQTIVITGAFASGKTHFIRQLLLSKPSEEVWAVLINAIGTSDRLDWNPLSNTAAFGSSGDSAAGSVSVKELFGGCICCDAAMMTSASVVQLIRQTRPDRLIIESSGTADPSAVVDIFRSNEHLRKAVHLSGTVCCIDVTQYSNNKDEEAIPYDSTTTSEDTETESSIALRNLFLRRVDMAAVVVGTKGDLCGENEKRNFLKWTQTLDKTDLKVILSDGNDVKLSDLGLQIEDVAVGFENGSGGGG